jgi:hypothetical protein
MGQVSKGGAKLGKSDHPGPGSYDARPQTSAPAFQMLGRNIKHKIEPVPGPGQYNVASLRKSVGTGKIISQQERPVTASARKEGAPGPGSYELQSAHQRTGGKFSQERRVNPLTQPKSTSPGPGAYQAPQSKLATTTPSFS